MIPVVLKLRNFMSYGEDVPALDFSEFHVACLTGKNGHGKSALLDAITWALWGQARKTTGAITPDEGLLRIGCSEMEVELVFDLEGNRFRVIRKYAKTKKSGKRSLEFQFFDPTSGTFRPLTEGGIRATQQKINDVLRMDYDTFINSAFILQGRADEFTQKSPGERKAILANILGLSRYDELSRLAKDKANQASKQEAVLEDRMVRHQEEIANEEQYSSALQDVNAQLQEVQENSERYRQLIAEQQVRLNDLKAKQVVLKHLQQQRSDLQQRLVSISDSIQQLSLTQQQHQQIVAGAERIEGDARLYYELNEELKVWEEKAERYFQMERECLRLEREIAERRQRLEAELSKWQQTVSQIGREQSSLRQIIAQEDEIVEGYQRLITVRKKLQDFRNKRKRYESLRLQCQQLGESIRRAESALRSKLQAWEDELQRKQKLLVNKRALQTELESLKKQLLSLEQSERLLEQLQERGQKCKSELAGLEQLLASQKRRLEEEQEKLSLLDSRSGDTAGCPLCGQELAEAKRSELQQELQHQCQELKVAIAETVERRKELELELVRLRREYTALRNRTAIKDRLARRSGEIATRLAEVARIEKECCHLSHEISSLRQRLTEKTFAEEQQQQLQMLEHKLAELGFSPDELERLEGELDQLQGWEAKYNELEKARNRLKELDEELGSASQKAVELQQELAEHEFGEHQQKLRQLRSRMAELEYDQKQHKQIKSEWDRLKDAPVQFERLEQARKQLQNCEKELHDLQRQHTELESAYRKLDNQIEELESQLSSLEQVKATLAELETVLRDLGRAHERLVTEKAAYQSKIDNCRELRRQLRETRSLLRQASREKTLYQHLSEAFGKNGIQALIIENAIPELEATANDMLARLTGNTTHITIESQREKKSGGTIETLDIKISDALGTRAYELYSGGEAFRVNFALRVALSKMLARRAGTKLRTLVIDEGFGTQDEEGLMHLVEAIQSISDEFDKIMVVTHLDRLKGAFPVHIAVTKVPETGSTFEVVHY